MENIRRNLQTKEETNLEVSNLDHEFSVIIVNDASTETKLELSVNLEKLNSIKIINMKAETRYIIDQMIKEKEHKKNNGPIELTADQLWKYSGEIEETNPNYVKYELERAKIKRYRNGLYSVNF